MQKSSHPFTLPPPLDPREIHTRVKPYDDVVGRARDAAGAEAVAIADTAERDRADAWARLRHAANGHSAARTNDVRVREIADAELRDAARIFAFADAAYERVRIAPFIVRWIPGVLDFDTGASLIPVGISVQIREHADSERPFISERIIVDDTCSAFEINVVSINGRQQIDYGGDKPRPLSCADLVSGMDVRFARCPPFADFDMIVTNNGTDERPFKARIHGMTTECVPGLLGAATHVG